MPYYRTCPICGAALDPGERCDCQDKEKAAPVLQYRNGQKVESESPNPHSTSDFNKRLEEMQGDTAYDSIVKIVGVTAANQVFDAWSKAADLSRKANAEALAREWYNDVYQSIDGDTWDFMCEHGFDQNFLSGIQTAHYDAKRKDPDGFKLKGESFTWAIFAYAFLQGQKAAQGKGSAFLMEVVR